jgi:serine/threonine protein kinase
MSPESWVQAERRLGRVLRRRWTLDRVIGVGGTATVYAGTHRNGSRVAIKVLHPWLQADAGTLRRFLHEGYIANSIGVPDVVKVIDDDVEGDIAYLVMELLEGTSVDVLCERAGGRIAPADVAELGCRLLRVLEAAHGRGVLHRDIKPANLFRTVDPLGFKVLDFGIARIAGDLRRREETAQGSDAGFGTPAFMAPEQARAVPGELDERTDLWAAGATLFTLLTGEYAHRGDSSAEIIAAARQREVPAVEQRLYGVPRELAAVVERAVAFDPGSRFQSAAAMKAACEDCRQLLAERGERSRLFARAERPGQAPARSSASERASVRPTAGGVSSVVPRAQAQPRAGYWSGRVGRLFWFYFTGPCTEEMWRRYLDMVKSMLEQGQGCTLACFAHCADAPSPLQRKQMADFIQEHRVELERLDRFALVIDSIVHRGAITAISWLVRKPFEERIFNSPISAIKWLTANRPELPPEAVRAAIVAQVPVESLWPALGDDAGDTLEVSA